MASTYRLSLSATTSFKKEIPVGTVFIALADQSGTTVAKRNLGGDRERIRGMATLVALEMLRRRILGIE
jgi:nicotinamide-nucleotide amidase